MCVGGGGGGGTERDRVKRRISRRGEFRHFRRQLVGKKRKGGKDGKKIEESEGKKEEVGLQEIARCIKAFVQGSSAII